MVLNKNLSAGDESSIIHTEGDHNQVIVNHYSQSDKQEIEKTVKAILFDNLPVFQSVAKAQVEASINKFIDDIFEKLGSLNVSVEDLQKKLSTPDMQYSLAESAKAFAKNPERVDQNTLIDLIAQKIEKLDDVNQEELSVLDVAISVTAKLTKNQIRWLAFLYYIAQDIVLGTFGGNKLFKIDITENEYKKVDGNFIFSENKILKCQDVYKKYIYYYFNLELEEKFYSKVIKINYTILISFGCIVESVSISDGIEYSNPISSKIKKRVGHDDEMMNNEDLQKFYCKVNEIFGKIANIDNFGFISIGKKIAESFLKTIHIL